MTPNAATPAVLVVDADRDTLALLREWLSDDGWVVLDESASDPAVPLQLVLVDLPFPRRGAAGALQRVATEHAGTPVLALSAMFHASIEPRGEVARSLGVAGVLPKPIRRDTLVDAVRQLSRPPP
jgi:DNA-binding response OmpR family regulator